MSSFLEVHSLEVDPFDAAVALGLADLAIQDVEGGPPNLAVWVVEGPQHREAGWFVDDRVVQDEQASMADPKGRVVHAPQQRRLGAFAARAERNDRLVLAADHFKLADE